MAIDRSAQAVILPNSGKTVSFDVQGLEAGESFTLLALQDFKERVLKNYRGFLAGELGIREVLAKPVDLFKYAYVMTLDALHHKIDQGFCLRIRSTIPAGCGLGSSAATVLSELRALGHYLRVDFRPDWYYEFSLEAEKLQHGRPSGVDSHISLYGGCARFQDGTAQSLPLPRFKMYLVQTGTPTVTTGESVSAVRDQFGTSSIWSEFSQVTDGLPDALARNDLPLIRALIRENHRLLVKIGVVPEKVQRFIAEVEQQGGAAKICGAGAVQGDQAGAVLVLSDRLPNKLCQRYGFEAGPVRGDPLGTRLI
jgi:mevalonate kinase